MLEHFYAHTASGTGVLTLPGVSLALKEEHRQQIGEGKHLYDLPSFPINRLILSGLKVVPLSLLVTALLKFDLFDARFSILAFLAYEGYPLLGFLEFAKTLAPSGFLPCLFSLCLFQ